MPPTATNFTSPGLFAEMTGELSHPGLKQCDIIKSFS